MKLEPWEIDLQNQLGNRLPPEKTVEPTVPVEPEAEKVEAPTAVPVQQEQPNTLAFIVLFVILALSTLYVYDDKTGGKVKTFVMSFFHSAPEEKKQEKPTVEKEKPQPLNDAEVAKLRTELLKLKTENKAEYDAIVAKLNTVSNKVVLMGLLLNENFNIISQNINHDEMVFFNRDWTLDKMPKYIELSDEDKDYLRKFVKEN